MNYSDRSLEAQQNFGERLRNPQEAVAHFWARGSLTQSRRAGTGTVDQNRQLGPLWESVEMNWKSEHVAISWCQAIGWSHLCHLPVSWLGLRIGEEFCWKKITDLYSKCCWYCWWGVVAAGDWVIGKMLGHLIVTKRSMASCFGKSGHSYLVMPCIQYGSMGYDRQQNCSWLGFAYSSTVDHESS